MQMKTATLEGYPYIQRVSRGVIMDIDEPEAEQVEKWLEHILYAWGVESGEEGPQIRITVEVIGPVKKAR